MTWDDYIPEKIKKDYEVHDFKQAAAILANEFPNEARELFTALTNFRFTEDDVKQPGGNESAIPKKISDLLRREGWVEDTLTAKMVIDDREVRQDTHKVNYLKGRVAFDLEWNSKDQFFDRELYAFRIFFDYDRISVGILVTRSNELDPWLLSLGGYVDKNGRTRQYKAKFGASTTHLGKLLWRLEAGRNGGCPVLDFGITTNLLERK